MVACGVESMLYVLPMLLGRTYDKNTDTVGIDIYDVKDIEEAQKNPIVNPVMSSVYKTIEENSEKLSFLDISGELALKISSGLLDIKGAGEYLKDTSNIENRLEILIKMTFETMTQEISSDAKPLMFWEKQDRATVGTHVINYLTFGGEVYASVSFIALKSEYKEDIKAQVQASISKSGAFDIEAQGKLEKLAQNISNKAKMEIDYYGTVPLDGVPTTLEGLSKLVANFQDQVKKVNDGNGVILCAGFRPLSEFSDDSKFKFIKSGELVDELDNFNYYFNNLREAKALLNVLVTSLPQRVSKNYMDKVVDFSGRLTKTLRAFHDVIGKLDLEKGPYQLEPAQKAFDENSKVSGDSRYTKEIQKIMKEQNETADPTEPRGVYVHWGQRKCQKASNSLFIGIMSSFIEQGIGAGINYLCLPENPKWTLPPDSTGLNFRTSKVGGVRYKSLSMFEGQGKRVEGKVAPCTVCEAPLRPSIKTFTGIHICPGDWVQEYAGYIVSSNRTKNRAEFVCVDRDPDSYNFTAVGQSEPIILPAKMSGDNVDTGVVKKDASLPCAVCSK